MLSVFRKLDAHEGMDAFEVFELKTADHRMDVLSKILPQVTFSFNGYAAYLISMQQTYQHLLGLMMRAVQHLPSDSLWSEALNELCEEFHIQLDAMQRDLDRMHPAEIQRAPYVAARILQDIANIVEKNGLAALVGWIYAAQETAARLPASMPTEFQDRLKKHGITSHQDAAATFDLIFKEFYTQLMAMPDEITLKSPVAAKAANKAYCVYSRMLAETFFEPARLKNDIDPIAQSPVTIAKRRNIGTWLSRSR